MTTELLDHVFFGKFLCGLVYSRCVVFILFQLQRLRPSSDSQQVLAFSGPACSLMARGTTSKRDDLKDQRSKNKKQFNVFFV